MSTKDTLEAKRDEVLSEYDDVQGGTMMIAVMSCIVFFTFAIVGMFALPPLRESGFSDSDFGTGLGITLTVIVVLAGIILPIIFVPLWIQKHWDKHHRHAWQWLKHSDMARLVMEPSRWQPMYEVLDDHPWMRFSGMSHCKTLDEQIEMASDYQAAMMLIVRREPRGMVRAVWWGSATRLSDDLAVWFLGNCGLIFFLVIGGFVLYVPLIPVWVVWLGLYVKRQAWQTALLEYYIDEKPKGYRKLQPPRELRRVAKQR